MTQHDTLKPCPTKKNTCNPYFEITDGMGATLYQVECFCGRSGSIECSELEAMQMWNVMTTPTPGGMRSADEYVKDIVSHQEAREIVGRMCNSHFNNAGEHMRASIPANPQRDDDLRLTAYIKQRAAQETELQNAIASQSEKLRKMREALQDINSWSCDAGDSEGKVNAELIAAKCREISEAALSDGE